MDNIEKYIYSFLPVLTIREVQRASESTETGKTSTDLYLDDYRVGGLISHHLLEDGQGPYQILTLELMVISAEVVKALGISREVKLSSRDAEALEQMRRWLGEE